MNRGNRQRRSMQWVALIASTVGMACSEPFTPPPPVTLEAVAGRYQLERVGKNTLPAYGPVICFLVGCGTPYFVTAGSLEIAGSTFTLTTSTRDANAPFTEWTGTRSGTISVDARGQLELREEDLFVNVWSGEIEKDLVTVHIFAPYTFRREK